MYKTPDILLPVFISAIIISCAHTCSFAKTNFSDSFVLPGLTLNLSRRSPYRMYDNMEEREQLDSKKVATFGVMLGKRLPITPSFRVQIGGGIEYGSSAEDTSHNVHLTDDTYRTIVRHASFTFLNLTPEFHFVLPPNEHGNLFFAAGAGFHYLSLSQRKADVDNTIAVDDSDLLEKKMFSFSGNIGAGFERKLFKRSGIAFVYNVRIWKPVQYTQTDDLFPMGAEYYEYFLTHTFQVSLLLANPAKN